MNLPPPLPRPIVTYHLCTCDDESCQRMPIVGARDVEALKRLRQLRARAA